VGIAEPELAGEPSWSPALPPRVAAAAFAEFSMEMPIELATPPPWAQASLGLQINNGNPSSSPHAVMPARRQSAGDGVSGEGAANTLANDESGKGRLVRGMIS